MREMHPITKEHRKQKLLAKFSYVRTWHVCIYIKQSLLMTRQWCRHMLQYIRANKYFKQKQQSRSRIISNSLNQNQPQPYDLSYFLFFLTNFYRYENCFIGHNKKRQIEREKNRRRWNINVKEMHSPYCAQSV